MQKIEDSLLTNYTFFNQPLNTISEEKSMIYAINAHSFNVSKTDIEFREAMLHEKAILLPDGIGIVWALNWLRKNKLKRITGMDILYFELEKLESVGGKCFFLGSSEGTLISIKKKINIQYPKVKVAYFSPPFANTFTMDEDKVMIDKINEFNPLVLFVGMTAPKQEKWASKNFDSLSVGHICCIGAAFDFYSGTLKRAPQWMMNFGLEWFYRLLKEPIRMFNRYMLGNPKFILNILKERRLLRKI